MKSKIYLLLFCISIVFHLQISYGNPIKEHAYQMLEKVREDKKTQLTEYLSKLFENAYSVKADSAMIDFFHLKRKYYKLKRTFQPPIELTQKIDELKMNIRDHYLWNYLQFYDILFVDREGDIFYTIKQQADYHKNIFQGSFANTALSINLKNHPNEAFVDYQYYEVSGEPSAFVIIPIEDKGTHTGWIVFQCAINKINNIFSQGDGLGATGEVFLVNKQHYMITDSRFYGESSIFRKHLSDENISSKFKEIRGRKIVTDYRGFKALSSFEVCKIANSEWLLISKIDEDEIITEYCKENKSVLQHTLFKCIDNKILCNDVHLSAGRKRIIVDMDEFRKVNEDQILCTYGVSTCTAVVFNLTGRFSYLLHISNLDSIYNGQTTDLIGNVMKRIKTFDIFKYERRNLQITIVANHQETLKNIIDRLLDDGIFLSQIKFLYNNQADYANLEHDYLTNQTIVYWVNKKRMPNEMIQSSLDQKSISSLLKPIIGYE